MRRSRQPPLYSKGKGFCRWCGRPIFKSKKKGAGLDLWKKFHTECNKEYKLHAVSSVRRKAVFERDKGICALCGKDCSADPKSWEADHELELADVPRPLKKEDRKYWALENLRTLCLACHDMKTKKSAKARLGKARVRRHKKKPRKTLMDIFRESP